MLGFRKQHTFEAWFCILVWAAEQKQPAAANVQSYRRRGVCEAEEAFKWEKLYHNSVLQVQFLGVLQSCLHMKNTERQVQTFLSLSAITWTRWWDIGWENERILKSGAGSGAIIWLNEEQAIDNGRWKENKGLLRMRSGNREEKRKTKREPLWGWGVTTESKEWLNEWVRTATTGKDALIQWFQRPSLLPCLNLPVVVKSWKCNAATTNKSSSLTGI